MFAWPVYLTAATFRGNHVLVLSKNHVTVFASVQDTQQTAVCGNATGRGHIFSSIPVLGCCQTNDCVVAEASGSRGQITLSRAVVGVEREWGDGQTAENVFGIYVQIVSGAQGGGVRSWNQGCSAVCLCLGISANTTKKYENLIVKRAF